MEYYQQLMALDSRVKEDTKDVIRKAIMPSAEYSNKVTLKKTIPHSSLTAGLRQSNSSAVLGPLQTLQLGDLASLRKSRAMLNRHLEEKARSLNHTGRDRRVQHEDFHKAIKNTGYQLDSLTRKMQFDLARNANASILPVYGGTSHSAIEHELRKSRLLDYDVNRLGQLQI
jgi:hypothetical protein